MSRHVSIGCDPGLDGAIAALVDGALVAIQDMPTLSVVVSGRNRRKVDVDSLHLVMECMLQRWVGPLDTVHIAIEKVGSRPKESPVASFSFGEGFGMLQMAAVSLRIPRTMVEPAGWKRALKMRKGKDASRQRAMEQFPSHRQHFQLVKHDGRAEAALIAQWAHLHIPR